MHKKSNVILLGLCVFISVLWLLPQIVLEKPNLLDIIETWSFGTNIAENFLGEFTNTARFRPIYTSTRSIFNLLFHYQTHWYFIALSLILAVSVFFIIRLTNFKRSQWAVMTVPLVYFFISPVTIDTYWRLGTAEYMFALFLVIAIYYLIRRKYLLAVISAIFLMLSKETAVFYIPIFVLFLAWKKRLPELVILGGLFMWYGFKIYSLANFANTHPDVYTSLFSSRLQSVWDMFIYYLTEQFFTIELFILSTLLCIQRIRISGKRFVHSDWLAEMLLIGVFCSGIISILFFHNKNWPYYFFPTLVSGIVFFARELLLAPKHIQLNVIVATAIVFLFMGVPMVTYERAKYWHTDYVGDGALISKIEQSTDTIRYEFAYNYWGGQYTAGVNHIYMMQSPTTVHNKTYSIIDSALSATVSDAEVLCGKSLFMVSDTCKWAVYERRL